MKNNNQNYKRNNKDGLFLTPDFRDELDWWFERYFDTEVHTSPETTKAQKRDLGLFLDFLKNEKLSFKRNDWTLKTTRSFINYLKNQTSSDGKPKRSDRSINRIIAHLKTFAKWINKIMPFNLFNPMLKVKTNETGKLLKVENALTSSERIKLFQSADNLIFEDAVSKDKHRFKNNEKPILKYKRPYRDRAIIYTLIETGMKRGDLINIHIDKINLKTRKIYILTKSLHKYQISKQGVRAIKDYIKKEREDDNSKWKSETLFLSPKTVSRGDGKLTPCVVNNIWNKVCKKAGVEGKTPNSSRHAMGKYLITKTGNPAAVQKQLGHINPAYSVQYLKVKDKYIEDILNER